MGRLVSTGQQECSSYSRSRKHAPPFIASAWEKKAGQDYGRGSAKAKGSDQVIGSIYVVIAWKCT